MLQEVLEWIGGKNDGVPRNSARCPVEGSQWYVLSSVWFNRWNRGSVPSGDSIDNTPLIQAPDDFLIVDNEVVLQSNLRKYRDFIPVPPKAWNFFTSHFAVPPGQTIIRHSVHTGNGRTEIEVNLLQLQISFALAESAEVQPYVKYLQISQTAAVSKILKKIAKALGLHTDLKCFRLWKLNAGCSLKQLVTTPSAQVPGTLLDKEAIIGASSIKHSTLLLCEIRTHAVPWMFKGAKPLRCSYCQKSVSHDPVPCECYKKTYCSDECREDGAAIHECLKEFKVKAADRVASVRSSGLANFGNTCYVNAGLQALANCKPFTDYFREEKHWDEVSVTDQSLTALLQGFGILLQELWSSNQSTVYPWIFKEALDRYAPQFDGVLQHDCHEFLVCLLDALHTALTKSVTRDLEEGLSAAQFCWEKYCLKNTSIVQELMHGQFHSIRTCNECGGQEQAFEPFSVVSMAIPNLCKRLYNPVYISSEGVAQQLSFMSDSYMTCKNLKDLVTELTGAEFVLVAYATQNMIIELLYDEDEVSDKAQLFVYEAREELISVFLHYEVDHKFFTFPRILQISSEQTTDTLLQTIQEHTHALLSSEAPFEVKLNEQRSRLSTSFAQSPDLPLGNSVQSLGNIVFLGLVWNKLNTQAQQQANDIYVHPSSFDTCIEFRRISKPNVTLHDCLSHFQDEEAHESICHRCNKSTEAQRRLSFERVPKILILHLKRFKKVDDKFQKNEQAVDFPEKLDFSEFVDTAAEYTLFSVVNHAGSLDSGHYFTYAKNPNDGGWYVYEDERVYPLEDLSDITSSKAYLLFYTT